MKPVDLRNENWADIRMRVTERRQDVYSAALRISGAWTTRQLAMSMDWDVVDVRPRVTELCELFLVEMVDRAGREGVYKAVPWTLAESMFERAKAAAMDEQMVLL